MATLDPHQQELLSILRTMHQNLAVARKTARAEKARRAALEEHRLRLANEAAREEALAKADAEIEHELAQHESALDEALIAAYNSGIPIRQMALEGFGNRYDTHVHRLLGLLRDDGRVGNREGYQRNTRPADEVETRVSFPEPADINKILVTATDVPGPTFTRAPAPLVLVEPDENGEGGIEVEAVILTIDSRHEWHRIIRTEARPGTPHVGASTCTLYKHPATGAIVAHESQETGERLWDHPVARWVKMHPEEARKGFEAALRGDPEPEAETVADDADA